MLNRLTAVVTLLGGAFACGGQEPEIPFSGLKLENCMLQTTTAKLLLNDADSGTVVLGPANKQVVTNGSITTCTSSRVYRISVGTHHVVVTASGSCSGAITAFDQQRPFPGHDTTAVSMHQGNC